MPQNLTSSSNASMRLKCSCCRIFAVYDGFTRKSKCALLASTFKSLKRRTVTFLLLLSPPTQHSTKIYISHRSSFIHLLTTHTGGSQSLLFSTLFLSQKHMDAKKRKYIKCTYVHVYVFIIHIRNLT